MTIFDGHDHTSGVGYDCDLMVDEIMFFGGSSEDSQEDLMWGKDWIKSSQNPSEPMEIISCYLGDKGILLENGSYKTFIFKKEKIHSFLKQALFTWTEQDLETKPVIVAYINKRFCYGLNQSKPMVKWSRDENKFFSRRVDDSPIKVRGLFNPFLPSDNPTPETATDEISKRRKSSKEKPLGEPGQAS